MITEVVTGIRARSRLMMVGLGDRQDERESLKGAAETLNRCSHVLIETVFEQMYENEPLFADLQRFLEAHEFQFARPLAFLRDRRGNIVQMDAIFRRERTPAPLGGRRERGGTTAFELFNAVADETLTTSSSLVAVRPLAALLAHA